jgi:DHA3 family tetracycline resistance protein-like MFS transporter
MAFFSGVVIKLTFTMSAIYRVDVVGLNVLQLVLLGTALELSVFLFEIPTGVIADVYSRRLSVIIGTGMMGAGFILEGAIPTYLTVLLAQVVWGFGWTFISGARSAWITDEVGVERAGKLFLGGHQLSTIGSLLGIVIVVPLARISLQLPYLVGGGLYIFLAIFLVLLMDETGFQPGWKDERHRWKDMSSTLRSGFHIVQARTALFWFALIALVVGFYSEGWDRLKEPFLLQNHSFPNMFGFELGPVEWFAILSIIANLMVVATNQITKTQLNTSQKWTIARALQIMYAVMVASMVGFALTDRFWIAAGFMLVFDTVRSTTFPLTETFVNLFIESDIRATVLSMVGQIDALGQISGGPVIGYLGQITSIPVAILTAAGILLPTVPLFGVLLSKEIQEEL